LILGLARGKVNHLLRGGENILPNNSLLSQQQMGSAVTAC
jgi:hypothetical protein